MRRIDYREGLPGAHLSDEQSPAPTSHRSAITMVDAIMEELAMHNVDLETVTLKEMKQLFSDACRDC